MNICFSKLVSILKIGAYFFFVSTISNKLQFFKVKKELIVFFVFVIVFNVISAVNLIWDTLKQTNDVLESILLVLYSIIMGAISVNYNFRFNTKRSLYFLYFIFALILSDSSWFIAYFIHYKLVFNLDILFYCSALLFMNMYVTKTRERHDILFED